MQTNREAEFSTSLLSYHATLGTRLSILLMQLCIVLMAKKLSNTAEIHSNSFQGDDLKM